MRPDLLRDERGIALVTVLLVTVAVAAIAVGAALAANGTSLVSRYSERLSTLEAVADAGLEEWRSRLNGDKTLYPDTGYRAVETDAAVVQADGSVIPRVRRTTWVGPIGVTSGQYGVFGSVVSMAQDAYGNAVIRRLEIAQESFAKYAYFTDVEPSNISFGGGDQLFGPVHTNDDLKIYASGATFHGPVTTAGVVQGAQYGTFRQGYTENSAYISMPTTADLNKLRDQALAGNTAFTAPAFGALRLEFIAADLNGDGVADEGFVRAYSSSNAQWVRANVPSNYGSSGLRNSRNCGHYHANGTFVVADDHPTSGPDSWVASVSNATTRCYLGGSDSLFGQFRANDGTGSWLSWPGAVAGPIAGRADAGYLFPITRAFNPSFKGVIHVTGNVVISGVVRGQVTLAATGTITIADDITYASNPGAGTCADILGLFAGGDVVVADNTLNAPVNPGSGSNYFTYDDTKDEFIHAVVLTLNQFTVENYASGATRAERCEGDLWGRGCLYLTGGIIQRQRGAVGTIWNVGGTGYVKRYSYDACAFDSPPPYFPTTGHFARGRLFEVNPVNFSVGQYFDLLTPQ